MATRTKRNPQTQVQTTPISAQEDTETTATIEPQATVTEETTWTNPVTGKVYVGERQVKAAMRLAAVLGELPKASKRASSNGPREMKAHNNPETETYIADPAQRATAQELLRKCRATYHDVVDIQVLHGEKNGEDLAECGTFLTVKAAHKAAKIAYLTHLATECDALPETMTGGTNPNVIREKYGVEVKPGTKRSVAK